MKLIGTKSLSTILNIVMYILIIFAVVVMLFLPWITKWYIQISYTPALVSQSHYYIIVAILYCSGILAIIILNELRKIFNTCKLENPFVFENIKSLKRISFASIIIGVLFCAKLIVITSFMTMIVIFVFILASVFAIILAEVFQKAVEYKNEHDYTI